ncbi:MAG: hypothetical protein HYR64_04730 [Fimbriimonas ginsengisoli]|uniref:Uncharacterized protein n=1 Tax=Fimbriimonas ginsengisoli TaxID=1005039 RepID=A0A931LV28_FIMGI|nr:hypothetical protein [Fimbriimonas ginsengisoli]
MAGASLLALAIPGCGGGGGGLAALPVALAGTIDRSEIGGATLTVTSALQSGSPVGAGGDFATTTYPNRAILAAALDGGVKVRGLTTLFPPGRAGGTQIDAASTALTLAMMSPGAATNDPTEARTVQGQLQGLAAFGDFVTYLRANLPSQSLDVLVAQAQYQALLGAVLAAYGALSRATPTGRGLVPDPPASGLTLQVDDQKNLQQVVILVNYDSWRAVRLVRRDVDFNGVTLRLATVIGAMPGSTQTSWLHVFHPGTETGLLNFPVDFTHDQLAEYWMLGAGFGSSGFVALPTEIDAGFGEALARTFLASIHSPLFAFAGLISDSESALSVETKLRRVDATTIDGLVAAANDLGQDIDLNQLAAAGHAASFTNQFASPLLTALASAGVAVASDPSSMLAVLSATFSAANLTLLFEALQGAPSSTVVKVTSSGGTVGVGIG